MLAYQNQPLKEFNKTFLRDIPKESYEACKDRMPARFARRAEHFYSEYRRVRQGVTAWETGNLELFGKHDVRNRFGRSQLGHNLQRVYRDMRLVRYFPAEALCEPFFRVWHYFWRWYQKEL